MLKLTINVEDLDYDALVERFLPQLIDGFSKQNPTLGRLLSGGGTLAASAIKGIISRMPLEKKEAMAAELLERNSGMLTGKLENLLLENGVKVRVSGFTAKAQNEDSAQQ